MEPPRLTPEDLLDAARLSQDTLLPLADRDWSGFAHELEWTCRKTADHIAGALVFYSTHLANRARKRLPRYRADDASLPIKDLIEAIPMMAWVFAEVIRAAPPGTRAWHPEGLADLSGFIAMGCSETLIHTNDITQAMGTPFDPPNDLCGRVARRLFPWAPKPVSGWEALRWGNGRIALAGNERLAPDWSWQCAPLNEWDGTIKKTRTS